MAGQSNISIFSRRDLGTFVTGLVLGALLIWLVTPAPDDAHVEEPVVQPSVEQPEDTALTRVGWAALPGWTDDDLAAALGTFNQSCKALLRMPAGRVMDGAAFAGTADDWHPVCELASFVGTGTDVARLFFEEAFVPFAVTKDGKAQGLFTGYYVPVLPGRLSPEPDFNVPLLARPDDLVSVDLGQFNSTQAGRLEVFSTQRHDGDGTISYILHGCQSAGLQRQALRSKRLFDDLVKPCLVHTHLQEPRRQSQGSPIGAGETKPAGVGREPDEKSLGDAADAWGDFAPHCFKHRHQ